MARFWIRREDGVRQRYHARSWQSLKEKGYIYEKNTRTWFKPEVKEVKPPKPPEIPKPLPKPTGVVVSFSVDYRSDRYVSRDIQIDAVIQDSIREDETPEQAIERLSNELMEILIDAFGENLFLYANVRGPFSDVIYDRKVEYDVDVKILRRGWKRWRRVEL